MARVKRLLVIGTESHLGRGVVQGVHDYCRNHGEWEYHLETDGSPEAVRRSGFAVRHWKADGIIARINNPFMERRMNRYRIPVINFSGMLPSNLPTVTVDNSAVGEMAAQHFLDNGFRHFGFCALTGELYVRERHRGFASRLAKAGFACEVFSDRSVAMVESDWVKNRRRMDQWLRSLKKPAAVMCMYDIRGQETALACRRLGLRVPDDVALIGADNQEGVALMSTPPLSSVDLNLRQIGHAAARLMDKMIKGAPAPTNRILIPPRRVVIRQSSDSVAISDPDISAAIRYIRDHVGEPLSVKDLLREIPISRKAMERRFEACLGRTPKAEIMRVRMQRAKDVLSETNLPIPVVAQRSGFGGQEIFSVTFRRKTGLTPTAFRRAARDGESS